MVAVFILGACLAVSALLVLILALYCLMQCWRQRAHSSSHKCITKYSELPLGNACRLPVIKISGASSCSTVNDSKMYGTCSHPATFEAGTDSVPATPPTPGSPASFTSSSKEPLLLHDHNSVPFWHRVVSLKQNGSVNHAMNATLIDDDAQQDDQEIDDRSVEHYESGSCEKSSTRCFRGTLTFALRYDFIHRVLMVHVIRANHLPSEMIESHRDVHIMLMWTGRYGTTTSLLVNSQLRKRRRRI